MSASGETARHRRKLLKEGWVEEGLMNQTEYVVIIE